MKNPILLLILVLSVQTISAQKPLQPKQIDSLVAKTMSKMPLAGIAVAVVKDGKLVHAKGYGVNSIKTKEKTDENTLFAIASNSKAFTTAALAILVEEGKISWQDKVVTHIPEFKMYDPYVTANFNIQDLLTHRSGLGLGAGDLMFFPDGSDHGINDIVSSFQYMKPVSAFRTKFDYDNLLYMVAGEIVKRKSGMNWSEFVEKRIMAPLNMKRSAGLYNRLKDAKNVAAPHTAFGTELKQIEPYSKSGDVLGAAGGIYSSVSDLSQWVMMHLNDGKLQDGKQLFSSTNHAEMWKPHTNMNFTVIPNPRYKSHFNAYGLGWDISDKNGFIEINHTGGLPGMLSKVAMIPELKLGVIVLTNTDPGGLAFHTITQSILDSYLGLKPQDNIGEVEGYLKGSKNSADSVVRACLGRC
jgi:CubicO group peptidase (beta-lactamase class C family)